MTQTLQNLNLLNYNLLTKIFDKQTKKVIRILSRILLELIWHMIS